MKPIDKIRSALQGMHPVQLRVALEGIAFMFVEEYLEHNPIPVEATAEEKIIMRDVMIAHTIAHAVNAAAVVITEENPNAEVKQNVADIAAAAIAKAAGKLN